MLLQEHELGCGGHRHEYWYKTGGVPGMEDVFPRHQHRKATSSTIESTQITPQS